MPVHLIDIVNILRNRIEQLTAALDKILRNVISDAADSHVAYSQAAAAAGLDQVVDLLSRTESVPEIADRAEIDKIRSNANEVIGNSAELRQNHAYVLR